MLWAMAFALAAFDAIRNVELLDACLQLSHLVKAQAGVVRIEGTGNPHILRAVLTVIAAGAGDQRKPFQYGNCLSEQFLFLPG